MTRILGNTKTMASCKCPARKICRYCDCDCDCACERAAVDPFSLGPGLEALP